MSPGPETVCQLISLGWSVTYGVDSISFWCYHRSIRLHDSGHVEIVDLRDPLSAPSLQDQVWRAAIDLLGIDLTRLEFNPFRARWAYPLGAGRAAATRAERARSAR